MCMCMCQVLDTLHLTYDSIDSADDRAMNVLIMLGMALVYKVHGHCICAHCVCAALHEHCIRTLYIRTACVCACCMCALHILCMALALKVVFVLVLSRTVEQSDSPKEHLTKATTANAAQQYV